MPKSQIEIKTEVRSGFIERRRLRRIRMIVELTHKLISSDMTVSHREARAKRSSICIPNWKSDTSASSVRTLNAFSRSAGRASTR